MSTELNLLTNLFSEPVADKLRAEHFPDADQARPGFAPMGQILVRDHGCADGRYGARIGRTGGCPSAAPEDRRISSDRAVRAKDAPPRRRAALSLGAQRVRPLQVCLRRPDPDVPPLPIIEMTRPRATLGTEQEPVAYPRHVLHKGLNPPLADHLGDFQPDRGRTVTQQLEQHLARGRSHCSNVVGALGSTRAFGIAISRLLLSRVLIRMRTLWRFGGSVVSMGYDCIRQR
jgi:hypothetical protein